MAAVILTIHSFGSMHRPPPRTRRQLQFTLRNAVTSIPENTSTAAPVKLADIVVTDDGIGRNQLTVTGSDASFFRLSGPRCIWDLELRSAPPSSPSIA